MLRPAMSAAAPNQSRPISLWRAGPETISSRAPRQNGRPDMLVSAQIATLAFADSR